MKVALVHEFLTQYGGAERVLEALLEIFPNATIHTLVFDRQKMGKYFGKYEIKTSWIQKMPLGVSKYKWYLPIMHKAIESFDFEKYDLVLSDASAFAKGVITKKNTLHICYCHTPTRYLWNETEFYLKTAPIPFFIRPVMPYVINNLKKWDYKAAQRPDFIIANSKTIQKRIKKYYDRDSVVIHPFVDVEKFCISKNIKNYYLIAGRMVPYKRYDIVIKAFNNLDKELKVVGSGYGLEDLKKITKSNKIEFLGRVSDKDLVKYYSECIAYVFPALEDFGITPLEAMASGRPVIAYKAGGATETVVDGKTGSFFINQDENSLTKAIEKFNHKKFNPLEIRNHALKFAKHGFKDKIKKFVNSKIKL